mmetsp:Transcript_7557/g.17987  ORF Transcript_7557/g.17987 Transcript_7557/m.17987 type:complete len:346 (-) Transcript_7557:75-1112(-)
MVQSKQVAKSEICVVVNGNFGAVPHFLLKGCSPGLAVVVGFFGLDHLYGGNDIGTLVELLLVSLAGSLRRREERIHLLAELIAIVTNGTGSALRLVVLGGFLGLCVGCSDDFLLWTVAGSNDSCIMILGLFQCLFVQYQLLSKSLVLLLVVLELTLERLEGRGGLILHLFVLGPLAVQLRSHLDELCLERGNLLPEGLAGLVVAIGVADGSGADSELHPQLLQGKVGGESGPGRFAAPYGIAERVVAGLHLGHLVGTRRFQLEPRVQDLDGILLLVIEAADEGVVLFLFFGGARDSVCVGGCNLGNGRKIRGQNAGDVVVIVVVLFVVRILRRRSNGFADHGLSR